MRLTEYKRIRTVIAVTIGVCIAYGVIQNSVLIAVMAVTLGMIGLHVTRRRLTEVAHDERTILIRSKAASATLAIITVAMAIIGLSLVFVSGHGMGNYEQAGYLLAYQANLILGLNALLSYYYRKQLGG
jgi:uncharacterized membrane protein